MFRFKHTYTWSDLFNIHKTSLNQFWLEILLVSFLDYIFEKKIIKIFDMRPSIFKIRGSKLAFHKSVFMKKILSPRFNFNFFIRVSISQYLLVEKI